MTHVTTKIQKQNLTEGIQSDKFYQGRKDLAKLLMKMQNSTAPWENQADLFLILHKLTVRFSSSSPIYSIEIGNWGYLLVIRVYASPAPGPGLSPNNQVNQVNWHIFKIPEPQR